MIKRNKIILISVISVFCVFILAAAALIVFFPSEKVRQITEAEATKALGMPVAVKQLKISFMGLPSITANGIKIGLAEGSKDPLAEIESVKTGINLIKILWGEIEITSVKINKLSVHYVIPPKDTTSADSLKPKKQPGPPSLPLPLTLRKLELKQGKIEIINLTAKNVILLDGISQSLSLNISKNLLTVKSKGTVEIENVVFSTIDSTGAKKTVISGIPVKFTHRLDGNPSIGDLSLTESGLDIGGMHIKVNANIKGWQKTDFSLDTGEIDAAEFLASFPASVFPDKAKISASGKFVLGVKGSFDNGAEKPAPVFTGTVKTDIKNIAYKGLPKKIDSVVVDAGFTEKTINIASVDIKAGTSKMSIRGKIDSYNDKPLVGIKINGNIETSDLKGALPALEKSKLDGGLDIALALDGSVKEPSSMRADGALKFRSFVFEMPKTLKNPSKLTGAINVKPEKVSIDNLAMISGKSDLTFNGILTNYMYIPFPQKGKVCDFKGKLTSVLIDVFDLIVIDKSVPMPKPWDFENTIKTAPIPPSLAAETEINLGKILMGKMKFDSAKGLVSLKNGKLTLSNLVVSAYNGSLNGQTTMNFTDLKNVTYDGGFALNGFDSGAFIADFFGAKNFMKGKLSTKIAFSGAGLDSVSMLKNLQGEGDMKFENGEISGWDFTDNLGNFLKFMSFKGFAFETIANTFSIKDRKVYTPGLTAKTVSGTIVMDGYTGFDKALDYKINLNLNKTYAEKALKELSVLSKIAKTQPNSLELVVNAKGTLNSPKFTLNTEGAEKQLKSEIKTKVEQIIDKNIKNDELKNDGKKILNRIFKKK